MSRPSYPDDTGWNEPRRVWRPAPRRRRRAQQYSPRQRVAAWTSVALVGVMTAGVLVAYVKYRAIWDSIHRVDVAGIVGTQPPKLNNAENILLIGSDTQRIQRDQYLMAALVQGIERRGLPDDPAKITKIIDDVAGALTTDTGLDQDALLQIADSMRGVSTASVQFVTAPNVPYPPDIDNVEFEQPQADELFGAIAHDTTVPKAAPKPAKGKKAVKPTVVATTSPAKVNVNVLNGTDISQLASQTAGNLTSRGFQVAGTGDATNPDYTTSVIGYASAADLPAANTLKEQFSDVELMPDTSLTPGTVTVILGSSFTGLASPHASGSSQPTVTSIAASDQGFSANTRICSDQAAFAGPDG